MRWCALLAVAASSACALFPDLGGLTGDAGVADTSTDAASAVSYARTITITNNATVSLPVGYTIGVVFPETDLDAAIGAGKIRSDLGDLRARGTTGEIDRIVDAPPLARVVWFSLTAPIAAGATDTTYSLTYGAADAGTPPANGAAVFGFYDDFDGATLDSHWLSLKAMTPSNGTLTFKQGADDALTTMVEDPQTTVELRVQVTNPASSDGSGDPSSYTYWFGFQHTGDFNESAPWALWLSSAVSTISANEANDGCSNGCESSNIPQTTAFRIYGIERAPKETIYSVDGAMSYTANSAINDQPMSIMIRNFLVASDIVVDWVRSRTQIYPQPTVTLGVERPE